MSAISHQRIFGAIAVAFLAIAAPACSSATSPDSDDLRQSVVTALATDVMVPAYERLATDAAAMSTAIDAACASPTDAALLDTARQSWSAARTSWLLTRAFRFGPATTLRTMSTIDFPIDLAKIDKLVGATDPVAADTLAGLGADQRGLGGIEYVLFGDAPLYPQSCSYLVAAGQLVAAATAGVREGWTTGIGDNQSFAEQMTNPGQGGMYTTENEALGDLINSMIFAIADVADARIGRASGDVTGTPVPEEIDAGLAHRAKQDSIDVITGVQSLFDGAAEGAGISAIVSTVSQPTATTMGTQLTDVLGDLGALNDPLAEATDSVPAHTAYEALKAAQVTLRAEIASQLGVTLTFGDADGDS